MSQDVAEAHGLTSQALRSAQIADSADSALRNGERGERGTERGPPRAPGALHVSLQELYELKTLRVKIHEARIQCHAGSTWSEFFGLCLPHCMCRAWNNSSAFTPSHHPGPGGASFQAACWRARVTTGWTATKLPGAVRGTGHWEARCPAKLLDTLQWQLERQQQQKQESLRWHVWKMIKHSGKNNRRKFRSLTSDNM